MKNNETFDLLYSDHNYYNLETNESYNFKFKPDYSPDTLKSYNYIEDLLLINISFLTRKHIVLSKMLRINNYNMILFLTSQTNKIKHIAKTLYYKLKETDDDFILQNKPNSLSTLPIFSNDANIIKDEIYKKRLKQSLTNHDKYKFSIIILSRNAKEYIIPLCNKLITNDLNKYYEVIIGDTGTTDKDVLDYYKKIKGKVNVVFGLKYHFSKNYNYLIKNHSKGEYVGILNNDIILPNHNFIYSLESILQRPDVGTIGSKLMYPDGTIQHAGVFFIEKDGEHKYLPYHRLHKKTADTLNNELIKSIPANTGAFLFCKKNEFLSLGGFDENYEKEGQDVDLCLKYLRIHKKNIFLNIKNIVHIENGTRPKGEESNLDRQYLIWKWKVFLDNIVINQKLNNPKTQ